MKTVTGIEIVVEYLEEQGVDTVFGYPGGTILNVYGAPYKHQGETTRILTPHEQGTAHAADGCARATGKMGVCMATSGSGATSLVTGIVTAYMDSVPMVVITCNVTVSLFSKDSFQEVGITGMTMPITKYNFTVRDTSRLAYVLRGAFTIAESGRPGPVLVDITKDVAANTHEYEYMAPEGVEHQADTITEEDMGNALALIRKSKKPFIFMGSGTVIADTADEVRAPAHKIQTPVTGSLVDKGTFDGTDELYTGMVGMHGTKTPDFGFTECGLLIVVGAQLDNRVTGNTSKFAENTKIFRLDVDPTGINKDIKIAASVAEDVRVVLRKLNTRLDPINHDGWIAHIERMKDVYPLWYDKNALMGLGIIETIYELTQGDAIITAEAGQHQMWAAQFYKCKAPRTFLTSGGLGTTGCGLGASVGAKMGCKDKIVFNVVSDGCFRMNMNETVTATHYNIPIIQIVVNNHVLGMVRQ